MNIVFFCVGSTKVVSDSFAPFTGSYIKKNKINAFVYGSINSPVNSINLDSYIDMLKKYHSSDLIIVIDTRIINGSKCELSFSEGMIEVASASLKRKIGDFHMTLDIPIDSIHNTGLDQIMINAKIAGNKLIKLSEKIIKELNNDVSTDKNCNI